MESLTIVTNGSNVMELTSGPNVMQSLTTGSNVMEPLGPMEWNHWVQLNGTTGSNVIGPSGSM